MTTYKTNVVSLRISEDNPNHHLYRNNGGYWWVHYTVYPTRVTAERIRRSLKTRDLEVARRRRDEIFSRLGAQSSCR